MLNKVIEIKTKALVEVVTVRNLKQGTLFVSEFEEKEEIWRRTDEVAWMSIRLRDGFLSTEGDREVLRIIDQPITLEPIK